jgi:opacity protein-like surface antigen
MKINLKEIININLVSTLAALAAMGALKVSAQTQSMASSDTNQFSVDDDFRYGFHEVSVGSGVYFSNIVRGSDRPNINYAIGYARVGFMAMDPQELGFFRGNLEIAPELFGADIYDGPGSYIAGGTLWFRYNFIPKGWKVLPFVELGGGLTDQDLPHNYDGKDFNFNLDAGVGMRYFIRPKCSVELEYRFQHISNADIWDHNVGSNASGPTAGISLFF